MSSILATKLRLPAPSSGHVQRPRILQALRAGLSAGRPLTLVSAPAGFGKTSCVCEWLAGLDLPVAWLALDPADDDPGRFFTYFLAALHKVDERLGAEIQSVLRAGELPPVEVISTALINDILEHEGRFLLVLDDFHVIQERFILQVLEKLISNLFQAGLQQPLHLALITREDPPLPLARLRANSQMTEVRAGDLRFTGQEAERYLNETLGLSLSQANLAALEERTEGWIVGLHLAGLSIRGQADPSGFIAGLSGSHRYILSYLTEEVLSRQPQEIQQFLLDTAILDRLCGDLCDAVTGQAGGRALLERLCSANLFLVPLDNDAASGGSGANWYRYHPLFSDLLRDRQNALQKERTPELHRRASQWYAQADEAAFAGEAIRHALAAEDYASAVRLIERHSLEMLMQWYSKKVAEWMQALPPEWAAQSPRANLAFAWMHLMRRSFQQAAPYLERLYGMFAGPRFEEHEPSVKAEWLALQATLCSAQGKPAECIALAQQALEIVPQQDGYVRSLIYLGLAGAYQQLDDQAQAMEAYRVLIQYGRASGNLTCEMLGASALGLLAIQQGQLHYAFEIATQGIERVERLGVLPPIAQALYGEVAQVHYQWHQLDLSRKNFVRAIQVSALNGYSEAEVYQGVIFSRLYQMEGDLENAAREIRKAADRMQAEEVIAINEEAISQQVRVYLAQGRISAAEAVLAGQLGLAPHAGIAGQPAVAEQPAGTGELPLPDLEPGHTITYSQGLIYNSALRVLMHRGLARLSRPAAAEEQPAAKELPAVETPAADTDSGGEPSSSADLAHAIALAGRLIEAALRRKLMPAALESLLLRAQMHAALGDQPASLADLSEALEMAEPEGFISPFIEEGQPLVPLLKRLLERGRSGKVRPAYIRSILAAYPGRQSPGVEAAGSEQPGRLEPAVHIEPAVPIEPVVPIEPAARVEPAPLNEALTDRELDVLRLIADGLKYNEIAERLYVSLNTVRTHVKVIYGKLGVNNRTNAIARARQHKLL